MQHLDDLDTKDLSREFAKPMAFQGDGCLARLDFAFCEGDKADVSNRSATSMDDDEGSATPEISLDEDTTCSTNASAKPMQAPDNSTRQKVASDEDILHGGRIELESLMPGGFVKISHVKSCLPVTVIIIITIIIIIIIIIIIMSSFLGP